MGHWPAENFLAPQTQPLGSLSTCLVTPHPTTITLPGLGLLLLGARTFTLPVSLDSAGSPSHPPGPPQKSLSHGQP